MRKCTTRMGLCLPVMIGAVLSASSAGLSGGVLESMWADGGAMECLHCRLAGQRLMEESARRWNAGTGKDLRNYAPDRKVDFEHMLLEIDIPDMNEPELSARQILTFVPIGRSLEVLHLDAMQMEIERVQVDPKLPFAARWSYDDERLSIRFEPPIPVGIEAALDIRYIVRDPADGLFWTTETPAWPGRPAQIHTQGQPNTNRWWFPCHDSPNEQLTTELIVTVPVGFLVSGNGRLVTEPRSSNGRTTFHWLQDKPHVNYLVSLIVGKFDVVDVAPEGFDLPLPVYVPEGWADRVERTYGRTAAMVRVFEDRFDEPYPWDRYAQLVVWNFGAGGMENTSATTMYDTAALDEKSLLDDDLDGLIAHELGHQWFGDLITCKTWAHIWLNEGWATYSTALWYEARDGYEHGYRRQMWSTMRGLARRDHMEPESDDFRPGMVSPVYEHPWEVFRRVSNPYPKGSSILHMLRMKLGEELFFDAVAEYIDRFKFDTVETHDFRRTLEDVSGLSLEQFFTQWCYRPGTPKLKVSGDWNEERKELSIVVEQMQRIDAEHPAFAFDLPVLVAPDGNQSARYRSNQTVVFRIENQRHERVIPLDAEPRAMVVDPELTVLADLEVKVPKDWLFVQMQFGPTLSARLDAAYQLRSYPGEATESELVNLVRSSGELYALRAVAADSLGKLGASEVLIELLAGGIDDAKVRVAAINALSEAGGELAAATLARHADDEAESYACRAAALEGLGKHGEQSHLAIFERALQVDSQHEQVRRGAIAGLQRLDVPGALDAVAPFTAAGYLSRLRPVAIEAVGELGHHDRDLAFETLAALLFDHEERSRRAAGQAMVALEDERGLAALQSVIGKARNPEMRDRAETWHDRLSAALSSDASIRSAQSDIARLEREVQRLRHELDDK